MRGPFPNSRPECPPPCLEQAATLVGQRTVPSQLRQRAALVLLGSQHPLGANSEAAQRVQFQPRAVRRWRHRGATGALSLDDKPGRGRQADFAPSART